MFVLFAVLGQNQEEDFQIIFQDIKKLMSILEAIRMGKKIWSWRGVSGIIDKFEESGDNEA